eukprot:TRINITY_DN2744_c0_g1_i1.p1 TRINITY_DN2744_c0_g1~~TRINITY_DN2744_c0_g1_i1.p1  ORF type:complete len:210 (-),score=26.64 TRINITY_DN2744_c0_g1_i1:428-1057(-)
MNFFTKTLFGISILCNLIFFFGPPDLFDTIQSSQTFLRYFHGDTFNKESLEKITPATIEGEQTSEKQTFIQQKVPSINNENKAPQVERKEQPSSVSETPERVEPLLEATRFPDLQVCSQICQHGLCDTSSRSCICDLGYTGEDCATPSEIDAESQERRRVFTEMYQRADWIEAGKKSIIESKSGAGSTIEYTYKIRKFIPQVFILLEGI